MNLLKRIGVLFLVCVVIPLIGLAAIEGTASVGLTAHDLLALESPGNYRQAAYDTLLGWVTIPNTKDPDHFGKGEGVTANAEGFRLSQPVAHDVPAGDKRIVCSGDSFTWGSGVGDQETFCAALERKLPHVRSLNLGQLGYGIDQMYLSYKRDGARYPHQINLFCFIWNDFERMTMTSFIGYPKPQIRLAGDSIVATNMPVPKFEGVSRWTMAAPILSNLRVVQYARRHMDVSDNAKLRRVESQIWNVSEAMFRDLDRLNKERGSKLVLVYLPSPNDLAAGPYDLRREKLADFAKKAGIELVDLTQEIRTFPADTLDWFFITANALQVNGASGHYTARGHDWVADRLAERLQAMGLVTK